MKYGTFAGRLGGDAELKYTPSGAAVAEFSLACTVRRKGQEPGTEWVQCSLWADRGEALARLLTKGSAITVIGEVSTHAWLDRQTGEARSKLRCRVVEIELQGRGKEHAEAPAASPPAGRAPAASGGAPEQGGFDDDIPF
jgi:single-strand DNA-binding protein